MTARRAVDWKFMGLVLASVLLAACASSPRRTGRGDLRLDTETVGKIRHAAALGSGGSAVAPAASGVVAATLSQAVPMLLTLLQSDNAVGELERRLVECARMAERQVNASHFGNRSPTREECGEEVMVEGCPEPITQAMLLGQQKHELALQCAREVLEELWPAPFSIEQRYRYYPNAQFLETVSQEEEARLIAQGCTRELWRTIKPDLVLHADRHLLRAVLIVDYKFPCPPTNAPRWREYGEGSAYVGTNQQDLYKQALGGEAVIISPQRGVIP